jgi:hypothetical protein
MALTKDSFHNRWIPRDMESFIKSYLGETEVKTCPTSDSLSDWGTVLNPKCVVGPSPLVPEGDGGGGVDELRGL